MRFFYYITAFALLLGLTSCQKDDDVAKDPRKEIEDYSNTQTLLMYLIADNNLSSFISTDLNEACQGYLKSQGSMNLQVYMDRLNSKPMLLNVRRNTMRDSLIYDTIKVWKTDHNSADVDIMSGIIAEAFSGQYNTPMKGIVMSSHGFGWLPNPTSKSNSRPATKEGNTADLQWIGQDTDPINNYMEIWELHEALEVSAVKLDYLMFDACFMSNAETLYEIKDRAEYCICAPCEIPGDGFNYVDVIQTLSTLQSKGDLKNVLSGVIDCYGKTYNDNCTEAGAIALVDLKYMDQVLEAYKAVRGDKTLAVNDVVRNDSLSTTGHPLSRIQTYGRFYVGTYYDFFDIDDVAEYFGDKDGLMKSALENAIVKEFHASMFRPCELRYAQTGRVKETSYESIQLPHCCGMSVSLPEMFETGYRHNYKNSHANLEQMKVGYEQTRWRKALK